MSNTTAAAAPTVVECADPGPTPSAARPAWVTDQRLDDWRILVRRDPSGLATPVAARAPYDLGVTAVVPACTVEDVAEAVTTAGRAQLAWEVTPFSHRRRIMLRFHDLLVEEQDEVLDLIQWETGKARLHAWQEVAQVATIARHYARKGAAYLAEKQVRGMVPVLTRVREVRVPKGVVGVISPWNYPLYLGAGDVIPALLAGNAVVSKADSQTALTLLWTRALMARAGLPTDLWQIVVGPGSVVGQALVDAADYVCFTGSTPTGRRVGEQAGRRLIGASLELGGKNALVVRADADLAKAVRGLVAAAYANTGQMCISIERVLVHDTVYDAFKAALVEELASLTIAQTYDWSADVGSLTSQDQLDVVLAHVTDAVDQGASVVAGGRARPDLGPLCFEPTVLEHVRPGMRVHDEETFGPVVSLHRFGTDHEAVQLANQGSYGLSASVWSRDTAAAEALARKIRAGAVNINDGAAAAAGSVEAGMGGMRDSGLGRRHGAEGIVKYTESQTLATQRLLELGVPRSSTPEKFVAATNRQLRLLRRLRVR